MNQLRIEIIPSIKMHHKLRKDINDWLISEFIEDGDETIWSDVDWHVLGWLDDQLTGHIDILERIVIVDKVNIPIAGIGGVVTKHEWRSKGIASKLMRKTHEFMAHELNAEFGLLMCDQNKVTFYQDLGWALVDNLFEYNQPSGEVMFDDQVMVYHLKDIDFPEGKIYVQGYPW